MTKSRQNEVIEFPVVSSGYLNFKGRKWDQVRVSEEITKNKTLIKRNASSCTEISQFNQNLSNIQITSWSCKEIMQIPR